MTAAHEAEVVVGCSLILAVAFLALHWLAHQDELGVPWWALHRVVRRLERWRLLKRKVRRSRERKRVEHLEAGPYRASDPTTPTKVEGLLRRRDPAEHWKKVGKAKREGLVLCHGCHSYLPESFMVKMGGEGGGIFGVGDGQRFCKHCLDGEDWPPGFED